MAIVDLETERYTIACLVQGEDYVSDGTAELLQDDFSYSPFQILFSLIGEMYQQGESITVNSFYIKHSSIIKQLGIKWIDMTGCFVNMSDFKVACQRLKEMTRARRLMKLSDTIRNELEGGTSSVDVLTEIEKTVLSADSKVSSRQHITPKEMAVKCLDVVAERMDETTRGKQCIFTGFSRLNKTTGGFEAGDLVILSGSTGGGKSAFAMNLSKDIAITQKIPCVYINSEMSDKQMALRWSALLGEVKHSALRAGSISDDDFKKIATRLDVLYSGGLHTMTMPDLRIDSVISEIRRHKARNNIRVAIVDYIGRMDYGDVKNKDDWQMLTGASRKLKTLAQEQGITVIMLAQLSESGKLAQASYMSHEADLWLNLRKPNESEDDDFYNRREPWNMVLEIRKGRNAPTGIMPIYFYGENLKFTDSAQEAFKYAAVSNKNKLA